MPDQKPEPTRVVLVGMMGSGKTTVGSLLAERLRARFFDTDREIVAACGMTVAEIFESRGEPAFRAAESEALARVLSGDEPAVVAAGGGAVVEPANRDLMRRCATVVWLRTRVATLTERLSGGDGRPLLSGELATSLASIDEERVLLYQSTADMVVDTDGLSPDSVVEAVTKALATVGRL